MYENSGIQESLAEIGWNTGHRTKNRWKTIGKILLLTGAVAGAVLLEKWALHFDAGAYTQAVLDAAYRDERENYQKLTGNSDADVEKLFQKNLDATMDEFQTIKLSEAQEENYRALFQDILKQVRYTVGEVTAQKGGNYAVQVEVEPMTLFDDTYDAFQNQAESYARKVTDEVLNGGQMPEEQEIQSQVYQIYYDVLRDALDSGVKYGKAQSVTLHVNRKKDGGYEIPEKDITALNEKLISREKLE